MPKVFHFDSAQCENFRKNVSVSEHFSIQFFFVSLQKTTRRDVFSYLRRSAKRPKSEATQKRSDPKAKRPKSEATQKRSDPKAKRPKSEATQKRSDPKAKRPKSEATQKRSDPKAKRPKSEATQKRSDPITFST
ncbi:hypothetical protein KAOT1_20427 [Kordia algicida OT-1]|uniref:Uncharacterized protein n=1 Tax=Kordia algicida OT-1 TaxID=391587 RepID=A9DPZ5_9FLAO|nr:hypothetical protein KAOT1_20427 [Kordia algicida OT-1]